MKLLVIKVSALGDVVHALPVLPYLNSVDPEMEIHWLVEEQIAPLLEGHSALQRVWRIRTREWRRSPAPGAFRMLSAGLALRRQGFDVVLDLQGNSKSGFFTWMTGAPKRFGFAVGDGREWPNRLAVNRKVALSGDEGHVTDRSLAIAREACPGGQDPPPAGPLPVDSDARRRVLDMLCRLGIGPGRLVVLHCGSTWKTKQWSRRNWVELATGLCRRPDVRPVLTWGDPTELTAVEHIAEACGPAVQVWQGGGLAELVALLQEARLVIGPDTGPLHIAAAVGTATVSIFRATDPKRNGPRGDRHVRLQSPLDCSPCLRKECPQDAVCADSIPASAALAAAERLLEGKPWKN